MRPILIFLIVAGAGIITWLIVSRPGEKEGVAKQEAIAVSKHSTAFNESIQSILTDYNKVAESLVNWDSTASRTLAESLIQSLEKVNLEELKKDSAAIYETALMFVENAKGDAKTIATDTTIRPQREAFHSLSDNFYQLLNTVNYDGQPLYLQECPMAFDDTKAALWLSEKKEIRNPYLGLHHPRYGKSMLECGATKVEMNTTKE